MTITSRHNPIVARYREAARGDVRETMLIDGEHLLSAAIDARVELLEAAVTPAAAERAEVLGLLSVLRDRGVDVFIVSAPVMDALSPVRVPTGIVALASRPSGEGRVYADASPCVAIAVDIQDPGNLGAIVRVAEAAGATGLVAAGACADPLGWKALRGSMGSALRLPIARAATGEDAVATARRHRCRIVATTPRAGRSLYDATLTRPLALLVGSEGRGIDETLIVQADERVTIPMTPPVESLNTAVAAALLLYEAQRQRMRARKT